MNEWFDIILIVLYENMSCFGEHIVATLGPVHLGKDLKWELG